MIETKETKQEITFDEFYNDLTNNWDNDNYIIEKITNLNLDNCNFLPWQKKFLEGDLLDKQGKYEDAFKCFQESNEIEENAYAMNNLSYYYQNRKGIEKNETEAIRLYKLAIEKGHMMAINNLGCCYWSGEGVEKNFVEAIKLFKEYIEKSGDKDFSNLLNCYKQLTFNQKYEFYKSLPKNSLILKEIQNTKDYENDLSRFDVFKLQEKVDELERLVYLPPYADPRFPNGGLGFQQALSSRNDIGK